MYRLRIVRTIIFTLFAFSTVVATLCAEVTADDQSSSLPSLLKAQGGGQTNPGAPPQDKTEEPRAAERVKPQVIAGVFTFRYESCDTDVGVFTCHFRVTNNTDDDRDLYVYNRTRKSRASYIVDSDGEKYFSKESFFGDSAGVKNMHLYRASLAPRGSAKLTVKFDDPFFSGGEILKVFNLRFSEQAGGQMYHANFKNITVKQ